jgi:hypothetical protein
VVEACWLCLTRTHIKVDSLKSRGCLDLRLSYQHESREGQTCLALVAGTFQTRLVLINEKFGREFGIHVACNSCHDLLRLEGVTGIYFEFSSSLLFTAI